MGFLGPVLRWARCIWSANRTANAPNVEGDRSENDVISPAAQVPLGFAQVLPQKRARARTTSTPAAQVDQRTYVDGSGTISTT